MTPTTRARDFKIDALRFLGLSLIILAHVSPPLWVFEARNFGAPLMVLLSGLSFSLYRKHEGYPGYVWRRVKRLLFPVWIFLTVYFAAVYLGHLPFEEKSWKVVLDSYSLVGGVGYLWIIRVLLVVALLAPGIAAASDRISDDRKFLAAALAVFLAYEAFLFLGRPYAASPEFKFLALYVDYGIAFGLIFAVGMRISKMDPKNVLPISVSCLLAYAAIGCILFRVHGHFMSTQAYKYPPSAYYLAYGLGMGTLTLTIAQSIRQPFPIPEKLKGLVAFIARNSLWIYLWHIPMTKILQIHSGPSFILRFFFVFSMALALVYLQVSLVEKLILPKLNGETLKRNVKTLFTG